MRVICDAREYAALQPAAPHVQGASEPLVVRIAQSLAAAGHRVDGIWTGDEELYVDGVMWWPWNRHPETCDVLISCEGLFYAHELTFDRFIVPLNKINPILSGYEEKVDAFVVFSEEHKRQLLFYNNTIKPEQVVIVPPGVEIAPEYEVPKRRYSMLWCHAPERGLVHIARQWPEIIRQVPEAELFITYGLEKHWQTNRWAMDNMAEELAECRRWVKAYPRSVHDIGRLKPHSKILTLQGECELLSYPADAPLPGIVTSLAVMEAAAAGEALLLSRLEGLPEVFGECAEFLDIPINEQVWADKTVELLRDKKRLGAMGAKAREWAKGYPWSAHAEAWLRLVEAKAPA